MAKVEVAHQKLDKLLSSFGPLQDEPVTSTERLKVEDSIKDEAGRDDDSRIVAVMTDRTFFLSGKANCFV
jgi:hypothetical protein